MRDLIQFIADYETVIYFALGVSSLPLFYKLFSLWQEGREARFGLERESSQQSINRIALKLFYLFVITIVVFVSVTYIKPNLPLDISDTPDENDSDDAENPEELASTTPEVDIAILPTIDITENVCDEETVAITSPFNGQEVSGQIDVEGTANIENFGFYKFEITTIDDPLWITIQAGRSRIIEGVLVLNWDTSRFTPGEYYIQLIVTDNENEEYPACIVPITIVPPVE